MTHFLQRLFRRRYVVLSFKRKSVSSSELARRYYETHRRLAEDVGMECPIKEKQYD